MVFVVKKSMRVSNVYVDELRMYNDAHSIRRGKKKDGYAPEYFKNSFSYKQPRRNDKGCGDVKWINTVTGEIQIVHCDEIRTVFKYRKPSKHSQYNLRYDRNDEE